MPLNPVILRERVAFQGIQRANVVLVRCRFNRAGRDRAKSPKSSLVEIKRARSAMQPVRVDLNHRPFGYEPNNSRNFNNLQDAGSAPSHCKERKGTVIGHLMDT